MGAGTTAVSAFRLMRNFCGAEIVKDQVDIAHERLKRIGGKIRRGDIQMKPWNAAADT